MRSARSISPPTVTPSAEFESLTRDAQFRDRIVLRVTASPEDIFAAARSVTLADMKVARLLGTVRYLPSRLAGHAPVDDRRKPFLSILTEGGTLILRDNAPHEIITGSAGRLHQIVDQAPVRFDSAAAFHAFDAPNHEKLFMSLRVAPTERPGEHWLILDHATQALSADAERQFRTYWRVIKPAGAFVSAQLLRAIRARAEHGGRSRTPHPAGRSLGRSAAQWLAFAAGAAAAGYAAYVGLTWARYGRPSPGAADERDELLDRFMPSYDIVERHHARVNAPASVTLDAARAMKLSSIPLVRAIFKGRELILGATGENEDRPKELVAEVLSLGWGVLAEVPGREVVIGAVTRPWEPNVTFRFVTPDAFAAFDEPGYVKIAWTLRADPIGTSQSVFRTETRAGATDAFARERFRVYWACLSPGIRIIRWMSLLPVKREAERRALSHLRA